MNIVGTVEVIKISGHVMVSMVSGVSQEYVDQQDNLRVLKSGDVMTGPLNMSDKPLINVQYVDFTIADGLAMKTGRMHWDPVDKTGVLDLDDVAGVSLQFGQEQNMRSINKTGVDIPNGKAVVYGGVQGQRPKMVLADNTLESAILTLGITTQDVTKNLEGYVSTFGIVRDFNTSPFSEGDLVYIDINGDLTKVKPLAPKISVIMGVVLNVHSTHGSILHKNVVIPRLSELSDVSARGTEIDKDILIRNAALKVWERYSMAEFIATKEKVRTYYDPATGERGFQTRLTNKTGAVSVKGNLVSSSPDFDLSFDFQKNEFDTFGIVAEAGIPDGSECWVWKNGSICLVLAEDGTVAPRAYLALAADTDGRADFIAVPSSNPNQAEHFKEIGHVLKQEASGVDVLVMCEIHFN